MPKSYKKKLNQLDLGSNIDLSEYSFFSHHDETPRQDKPTSWKEWIFGRKVKSSLANIFTALVVNVTV